MKDKKVLYQIKTLEKLIARSFCHDTRYCQLNVKKFYPTPTQMQIIEYILEHFDEDIYQKDLEDVLNLRRATVSGVLQTMEKNNLIKRVANVQDARTKKIILNEKAKEMFLYNKQKLDNIEDVIVKDIDDSDLQVFFNVLDKMKQNFINNYTTK